MTTAEPLPVSIGPGRARSVLLAGGLMDGTQARDIGIVSSLVEHHADLHEASERMIAHLSASAPNAIRATKSLLNTLDGSLDRELLLRAAKLSADVLNTPTTQAMLRAKLAQFRPPHPLTRSAISCEHDHR